MLREKVTDLEVQIAESLLSSSYHASQPLGNPPWGDEVQGYNAYSNFFGRCVRTSVYGKEDSLEIWQLATPVVLSVKFLQMVGARCIKKTSTV